MPIIYKKFQNREKLKNEFFHVTTVIKSDKPKDLLLPLMVYLTLSCDDVICVSLLSP